VKSRISFAIIAVSLVGSIQRADAEQWLQRYHDAQHSNFAAANTDPLQSILFNYPFDPDQQGALNIHYTDPLIESTGEMIVPYRDCGGVRCTRLNSVYSVKKLAADGTEIWSFTSDWLGFNSSWHAVFGIGVNNGLVYAAGDFGTYWVLNESDGTFVNRLSSYPLPEDPSDLRDRVWTTSPPSFDADGNAYWTFRTTTNPLGLVSALVKATPDGTVTSATFAALAGDATQVAAVNSTPAIGTDGTVFAVSTTTGQNNSHLLSISNTLDAPAIWNSSLRVDIPAGSPGGPCHEARPINDSTASPVVLPDGGVVFGGWNSTGGSGCGVGECPVSQGFLYKFDPSGTFQGCYQFGWDSTPGYFTVGGNSYLVEKHNHYPPASPEFYELVVLDGSDLHKVWSYIEPTTHEWCIDGPLLSYNADGTGIVATVPSEAGIFYQVQIYNLSDGTFTDPTNPPVTTVDLGQPQSAPYVPNVGIGGPAFTINNARILGIGAAP